VSGDPDGERGTLESGGVPLRVLGVPAYRNRTTNPYNALLSQAVARAGAVVEEARVRALLGRHDIVHIHWPEHLFSARSRVRAWAQAVTFVVILSWLRWRRARVVWTVHNLAAHHARHPRLEARMWRWFVRRVDGYIALSRSGREAVVARWPVLAPRPGFVIPHGHYRPVYPDTIDRAEARSRLELPPNARVTTFVGAIQPYKNLPALIAAFRGVPGESWRLVVAGRPQDRAHREEIVAGAGTDPRIRLDFGFVPDDEVQVYLRAADLVVLPYRDILNSGSAILALSFGVPVLVPSAGAMADLREVAGAEWVRTYEGDLTPAVLEAAMAWATGTIRSARPDLGPLEWDRIGQETRSAFETIRRQCPQSSCDRRAAPPSL